MKLIMLFELIYLLRCPMLMGNKGYLIINKIVGMANFKIASLLWNVACEIGTH